MTLGCGLAGSLSRGVLGGMLTAGLVAELIARLFTFSSVDLTDIGRCLACLHPRRIWPVLIMLPFLLCYVGGGFLPEVDFDVKEYHFGGPKEWFLAGKISFLPHNVYTSFPFLTEMLTLLGMVLYGDWYWGALAGKGVLMTFGPLTALGLFVAGRRWFSAQTGIWAALIHLSTPWIYRISIIAYAEGGLTCYLFATLLAVLLFNEHLFGQRFTREGEAPAEPLGLATVGRLSGSAGASPSHLGTPPDYEVSQNGRSWVILAGFLAGSAMACKYPGVVSVVIPLGLALLVNTYRHHKTRAWRGPVIKTGLIFSVGVALAIGPWWRRGIPFIRCCMACLGVRTGVRSSTPNGSTGTVPTIIGWMIWPSS